MGLLRSSGLRAAMLTAGLATWLALPASADSVAMRVEADTEMMAGADDPTTWYSVRHSCPLPCEKLPPSNWTVYSSFERLHDCDKPLLFDFALNNPVADLATPTKIRACTIRGEEEVGAAVSKRQRDSGLASQPELDADALAEEEECNAVKAIAVASKGVATLELLHGGVGSGVNNATAVTAAETALADLLAYFEDGRPSCLENVMFSFQQGAIAGAYLGQSFGKETLGSAAKELLGQLKSSGAQTQAVELCGEDRNAHHVLGIVVNTAGNITAVQDAVRDWNVAKCLAVYEAKSEVKNVPVWENPAGLRHNGTTNSTHGTNSTVTRRWHAPLSAALHDRAAECIVKKVVANDGCWAMADRCGISQDDLKKYNGADICKNPMPDQRYCCSAGELPDIRPKPDGDNKCFKYLVKSGDTCGQIASAHGLKWEDIDKFNNGTTWGWYGCGRLLPDTYICLSTGKPPMPFPIPNAVCGPTKPGSPEPIGSQTLLDISPCPLNACCNVWGQCGISGDFCAVKKSDSGNIGTSGLKDGCVMNCGMDIIKSTISKPLGRIGYYETWNFNRPCLRMFADSINKDGGYKYSIIHWAFAEINTNDWTVRINDTHNQWASFKALKDVKRVISFGGWAFSNEMPTYDILRQAMSPDNREKFAKNVAAFLDKEGIDGADYDWEYPGATDIEGTPPGNENDGKWYLRFLETQRQALSPGKTLSIAAPASFWYLKNFPIRSMARFLDYIVYMTYDLHGQWDYTTPDKKSYIEGCPEGNCIRSHVNLTETTYALSMITKAGVSSHLIYVGESSYGRSFKLAKAGCKGPRCQFTGTRLVSNAKKGRCTDTAGYISNAEINEIIGASSNDPEIDGIKAEYWHDHGSNSDMLLYEDTEWVAYMSETTRETRRQHWANFNFGGTIDWAIDLRFFSVDDMRSPKTGDFPKDTQPLPPALADCNANYDTLEKIRDANNIPEHCAAIYAVEVLAKKLKDAMKTYDDLIKSGYDKKFDTYADAVVGGSTKAVREYVYHNGGKYFTCTVTESVECCKTCNGENECKRCSNADDICKSWSPICDNPQGNDPILICDTSNTWLNISMPCPPDYSQRNYVYRDMRGMFPATYWDIRRDKESEFWAELLKATGIAKDDVHMKNLQSFNDCHSGADPTNRCANVGWDYNFPVPDGYHKDDVTNPKTIVSDAYTNLQDIVRDLPKAAEKLRKGTYDGLATDLADAVALPVFMIEEAVNGIKSISDAIDEANKEREKNIILAFLSAIFFFVPIVGQLVGTVAALANVARIIAILGVVGEVAIDIYSVVDTKGNDPLVIFGLVLAPLAIFDIAKIARAAAVARTMKQEDVSKLGKGMKDKMDVYKSAVGKHRVCLLKPKSKRGVDVFPDGGMPVRSLNGNAVWSGDFE